MSNGQETPVNLRFEFVAMLFALTVAEIAVQVAQLVTQDRTPSEAPSAYMHLLLTTALVVMSWVGWSTSRASLNLAPIQAVFDWPVAVLLIDTLLVIVYFIISKGVETPANRNDQVIPSAENETFWLIVVFAGYLLWDLLTKTLVGQTLLPRAWISVVCTVLAVIAWWFVHDVTTAWGVALADIALLWLVLLFRALKQGDLRRRRWISTSLSLLLLFAASLFTANRLG